jgi:phosphate transport system substrate-binding protein
MKIPSTGHARSLNVSPLRVVLWLCAAIASSVQAAPIEPPSHRSPPGVVRVWGNAQMKPLVQRWETGFHRSHRAIRVETELTGSDVGMAALYTGKADIAVLGRRITESEEKAFEWVFRYKPTRIEILNGSLDEAGKSPALVVFVHKDNPLAKLTLVQLASIFGHDAGSGETAIRTWGQLGLEGDWASQKISLYAPAAESGTGRFFRQAVLGGSNAMNWDALTEFAETVKPGPAVDDSGRRILAALAGDRHGIAVANLQPANTQVKPVALAALKGGPYLRATEATLIARTYPLTRSVYAYINRPPGEPVDPQVRAFLAHAFGIEGQQDVRRDTGYLPLASDTLNQSLHQLE